MCFLEKDILLNGAISLAGKASAKKYNILIQDNKAKKNKKIIFNKDNLFLELINLEKEKEKDNNNSKEEDNIFSFEDITKINQKAKIKEDIQKYFKEHMEKASQKKHKTKKSSNSMISRNKFIDIFSSPSKQINNSKNNMNNTVCVKGINTPLLKNKYKYHNIHMDKLLKIKNENQKKNVIQKEMNETSYNPNMKYIYNKINVGPMWKKISGRNNKIFEDTGQTLDKIYENINSNSAHSSFVDMEKQTQRNGFPINHDLRQRFESKFMPIDSRDEDIKWKKISKRPLKSISPFSRDKFEYKLEMSLRYHRNPLFYTKYRKNKDKFLTPEKCKSIPDFNRCIGRDYLQKLERKKNVDSNEMYYPNYNSVEERVKMMVVYNKNKHKKKENKFVGINSSELFNMADSFEKIYGNKYKVVPKFEKMLSRPEDKTLPSFMKQLFNKMSAYVITDKTLQLNNFSNGEYYDIYKNCTNNNKEENITINELKKLLMKCFKKKKDLTYIMRKVNNLYNRK